MLPPITLNPKRLVALFMFAALFCASALTACSGVDASPSGEAAAQSTSEALTTVHMYVQPGLMIPATCTGRLTESASMPTPDLQVVTTTASTLVPSTYSTSTHSAIVGSITPTECSTLLTCLSAMPGVTGCEVTLSYNETVTGTTKPLVGRPTFSIY